ncbi:MAG TPA: CDP-alcohol phosphatidyltransferase family protein [Candidatus Paceibacterota bacterium]
MGNWKRFRRHVPNLLTMTRGVFTLIIFALFHMGVYDNVWGRVLIADLFALAAMTDYYDGRLATKWDCKSKFGAFLDPHFDKLLSWAALDILWWQLQPIAPLLLFLLATVLLYDLATSAARVLEALGFKVKLVTSRTAKERTFILQAALAAFLTCEVLQILWPDPVVEGLMTAMLTIAFITAFVWTLKSGYEYFSPYFGRATTAPT